METTPHSGDSPEILFHLRWIAKIALSVGAAAAAGLVLMLYALTDSAGWSYGELIKSHNAIHYQLGPALLIGGFFLLAFTAVLTWLITLYSSFRIAGPLFRLARNLQAAISCGPGKPVPIRESDRLHLETALLEDSLAALAAHYDGLHETAELALRQLDAGEISAHDRQSICARLKQQLEDARI